MMYRLLEPEFRHADERGSMVQLLSGGCAQVNVLRTYAGVMRGGHYHRYSTESFYVVSGSVDVLFKRGTASEERTFNAGDFFEVPPYTIQTLRFTQDSVLIALYDCPVETAEGMDICSERSLDA